MLRFLGKGENLQKSAKICENLRLGSVCPLRFVPLRLERALRFCSLKYRGCGLKHLCFEKLRWETEFYTPPLLGGATLFDKSAPAVHKILSLKVPELYAPLALNCRKQQHLQSTGGV